MLRNIQRWWIRHFHTRIGLACTQCGDVEVTTVLTHRLLTYLMDSKPVQYYFSPRFYSKDRREMVLQFDRKVKGKLSHFICNHCWPKEMTYVGDVS